MPNIIVKRYDHFNRSLGKYITSKKHYQQEMAKQGMVDWETGQRLVEKHQAESRKEYKLSKPAEDIIREAQSMADSKGRIKGGDRLIDGMKKVGVNFDSQWCPKHYSEGGFDNAAK